MTLAGAGRRLVYAKMQNPLAYAGSGTEGPPKRAAVPILLEAHELGQVAGLAEQAVALSVFL